MATVIALTYDSWIRRVLPAAVAMCCISSAALAGFVDPIDAPALMTPLPSREPLLAIANAQDHLVAAGPRGLIVVSDAAGTSWTQAAVPVQSDLVALQFVDRNNGWACGHDGVILHSTNGGRSWAMQLNGRAAKDVFESYYNAEIGAHAALAPDLAQIKLNYEGGSVLPWLSLWFTSPQTGYAIGSFGDIATTGDAGKTWRPWLDHIDNPNFYDLNAIADVGGQVYIVGEQGMVYALQNAQDTNKAQFVAHSTGYQGTLFGLTGSATALIVFGLQGEIFRSVDHANTWSNVTDPETDTLMDGAVLPDGTILLVNVAGGVLVSHDDGRSFTMGPTQDEPLSDVIGFDQDRIAYTGLGGIRYGSPH